MKNARKAGRLIQSGFALTSSCYTRSRRYGIRSRTSCNGRPLNIEHSCSHFWQITAHTLQTLTACVASIAINAPADLQIFSALHEHLDTGLSSLYVGFVQAHREAFVTGLLTPSACVDALLILIGRHCHNAQQSTPFRRVLFPGSTPLCALPALALDAGLQRVHQVHHIAGRLTLRGHHLAALYFRLDQPAQLLLILVRVLFRRERRIHGAISCRASRSSASDASGFW